MSARSGLVVELRFEMDGRLIEAFIPPLIHHDGPMPDESIHWHLQIDQGSSFLGPPYAIYLQGQESIAEAEMRRFITDDAVAATRFQASRRENRYP